MNIKKALGIAAGIIAGVGTLVAPFVLLFLPEGEGPTLEELYKERDKVQADYNNPKLDMNYRIHCQTKLQQLDQQIGKKQWAGKEYGYPVHSEHGWHLSSDD